MRQKTLIALAIVTLPVVVAAIFLPTSHGTVSKPVTTGPVFPTLKDWLSGATKLTVTAAAGNIVTLARTGSGDDGALPVAGWGLADKGNYPVLDGLIRPVIGGLSALHTIEAKTDRAKLYDRIEGEEPGPSQEANSQLIDRTIVEIDPDKIKSLTMTPTGGPKLVLERDKPEDKLAIHDLPKDATTRSATPGMDISNQLRRLDLQDVRTAAEVTTPVSATAEIVTFDGLNATVAFY